MKGGGTRPRNNLFMWATCSNCEEVRILNGRHRARLKKKMGLGLLARGSDCGVVESNEQVGLLNQVGVVNQG
jgi:hypothetical protein